MYFTGYTIALPIVKLISFQCFIIYLFFSDALYMESVVVDTAEEARLIRHRDTSCLFKNLK